MLRLAFEITSRDLFFIVPVFQSYSSTVRTDADSIMDDRGRELVCVCTVVLSRVVPTHSSRCRMRSEAFVWFTVPVSVDLIFAIFDAPSLQATRGSVYLLTSHRRLPPYLPIHLSSRPATHRMRDRVPTSFRTHESGLRPKVYVEAAYWYPPHRWSRSRARTRNAFRHRAIP